MSVGLRSYLVAVRTLIPVIMLASTAIFLIIRFFKTRSYALYLAKTDDIWIWAYGSRLTEEEEVRFAARCQEDAGFLSCFLSRLKWEPLPGKPQDRARKALDQRRVVYFVSPGKLSRCDSHTFTFGVQPIVEGDSVFYMKAKRLSKGKGAGWGGMKVAIRLEGGVIKQEDALAHFGKEKLLAILNYDRYADDIEFISKEEYDREFGHEE
jgi:hypothetical protein